MNRSLAVERIFTLGDYQNLKVTDTVTEIPDAVASNPEAVKLLRYLQLVDLEWTYFKYMNLRLTEPKLTNQESALAAIKFLEEERSSTFEQLLSAIKSKEE